MEPITLGVAVISMIYGAGQYYGQIQKLNTFRELRAGLAEISRAAGAKPPKVPDKELLRWLSYSTLILPALSARLRARLAHSIAAILTVTIIPQVLLFTNTGIGDWQTLLTIIVVITQLLAGGVNGTSRLLEPYEIEFLAKADALQRQYYRTYVEPAIREFNKHVAGDPAFEQALAAAAEEDERIRRLVQEELKKRLPPG